jgi:hypothetical protein
MCLALLALATVLALYADAVREPVVAMGVGAVLLLAVATKYVGVLFVPGVYLSERHIAGDRAGGSRGSCWRSR